MSSSSDSTGGPPPQPSGALPPRAYRPKFADNIRGATPAGLTLKTWDDLLNRIDSQLARAHQKDPSRPKSSLARDSGLTRAVALNFYTEHPALFSPATASTTAAAPAPAPAIGPLAALAPALAPAPPSSGVGPMTPAPIASSLLHSSASIPSYKHNPNANMTDSTLKKKSINKKGTAKMVKKSEPKKAAANDRDVDSMDVDNDDQADDDGGATDGSSPASDASGTLYCDCQTIDDHTVMLECDSCHCWFHARCYNIRQDDATQLLIQFYCKTCTAETPAFKIQFKCLCRFNILFEKYGTTPECRQPVRRVVDGSETNDDFCSDDHRTAFFQYLVDQMPDTEEPSVGGTISKKELANAVEYAHTAKEFKALGKRPEIEVDADFDYNTIFNDEEITIVKSYHEQVAKLKARDLIWDERGLFLGWSKLKFKELQKQDKYVCGYNTLFAKNEDEFVVWRNSADGVKVFEDKKVTNIKTICAVNKCKKHATWYDNETAEFRMEKDLIFEELETLTRKEVEMKGWARTREANKNWRK